MSENHTVSLRPAPSTASAVSTPPPQPPRRRGKIIAVLILLVLLAGATWWYITQPLPISMGEQHLVPVVQSASTTAPTQDVKSDDMVARVGALIDLPAGETPTIATVSDPSKLEDQAFFAGASKGDIVLIYTKAHEAYLYDPVRNKLVKVAPVTTSTGTVSSPVQAATSTPGALKK